MTNSPLNFLGNLTGVSFRTPDEKAVVYDVLKIGDELRLEREPDNAYDENAVRVIFPLKRNPTPEEWYGPDVSVLDDGEEGKRLSTVVDELVFCGFIERGVAASLARWMDEGWVYRARVRSSVGSKMTPWLLDIEATGAKGEPYKGYRFDDAEPVDDDIPF